MGWEFYLSSSKFILKSKNFAVQQPALPSHDITVSAIPSLRCLPFLIKLYFLCKTFWFNTETLKYIATLIPGCSYFSIFSGDIFNCVRVHGDKMWKLNFTIVTQLANRCHSDLYWRDFDSNAKTSFSSNKWKDMKKWVRRN